MNFFRRRLDKLLSRIHDSSLEDYYDLSHDVEAKGKIKIKMDCPENHNMIDLTISYISKYTFIHFRNLPLDVTQIINTYLDDYLSLKIGINYPTDYPFVQPIWSFINLTYNFKCRLDLTCYYGYQIDTHNKMYQNNNNWNPAIDIDKDILEFIQKNNHFNMLIY